MFDTVKEAIDFLGEFDTADAIAEFFTEMHLTARPGCPETCAVAQYVVKSVPDVWTVTVDGDEVFGLYGSTSPETGMPMRYRLQLPMIVHEFVVNFDRGEYPTLIDGRYEHVLADLADVVELEQ